MIRQSPVSVAELALAGQGDRAARGSATRCRRRSSPCSRPGEIPAAAKLKAKFPASLIEVTRIPGPRGEDRAQALRRARRSRASTSSARRPRASGSATLKGLGPKAEENVLAALGEARRGGPGRAPAALRGAAGRRGARRGAARAPGVATRSRSPGSARRLAETCKDIDLIATASDPQALAAALTEHELAAAGRARRATPGTRIVTYNGISVDLRIVAAGRLRQPAPALHRLGRSTTSSCASGRVKMGLSVSEHGIADDRVGRRSSATRPRPRSTSGSGSPTSSPSCARGDGEIAAAAEGELPGAGRARRHPRRPALPHDALGRAQLARARWPRRRGRAATPTWRSPTTRRATGSATTSPPKQLLERVEEVAAYNAASEGALPAARRARRSTSGPTARSTTSPRCSSGSTGWSPASTPRSGSRRRR